MASAEKPLGVGLIGYEVGRSWAAVAHYPALQALPDFTIAAVATTREESARAAAADMGIERWFTSADALIACPEVDVVAITVKVPYHLGLVQRAFAAGKHVYCEWPLANGLREAEEMAAMAEVADGRSVVGLQARQAPVIGYVKDLVAGGELGDILSTTMVGSGLQWADWVDRPNSYLLDKRNGATMLTIPMGHALDALCYCLGEFSELSATSAIRRPTATVLETGEVLPKTSDDQFALSGTLQNGVVAVVHYRAGMSRGTNFLWEINGTKGDLRIEADGGFPQIQDLRLSGGFGDDRQLQPLSVPARYRWVSDALGGPAVNVAQSYMLLAQDIREGTRQATSFADALVRHRLIAAIEESAAGGQRITVSH